MTVAKIHGKNQGYPKVAPASRHRTEGGNRVAVVADVPGFVLRYKDDLNFLNWLNAPSGTANPVTIPTGNDAQFFRLTLPSGEK
jgi:hypothetical protein